MPLLVFIFCSRVLKLLGKCTAEDQTIDLKNDKLAERGCFCDPGCARFGDCCHDSPFFDITKQKLSRGVYECTFAKDNGGFMTMNVCPPFYRDHKIRKNCEGSTSGTVSGLPVIGQDPQVVYRNVYCAYCNGEKEISFVDVEVQCESGSPPQNLSAMFKQPIYLNTSKEVLDLNIKDRLNRCSASRFDPDFSSGLFRPCAPILSATCAHDWNDGTTRDNCEKYTSVTPALHKIFKNPFCAVCNYESLLKIYSSSEKEEEETRKKIESANTGGFLRNLPFLFSGSSYVPLKYQPVFRRNLRISFWRNTTAVEEDDNTYTMITYHPLFRRELFISFWRKQTATTKFLYVVDSKVRLNKHRMGYLNCNVSQVTGSTTRTKSGNNNDCPEIVIPEDYELYEVDETVFTYNSGDNKGAEFNFTCDYGGGNWQQIVFMDEYKVDRFQVYMGFFSFNGITVSIIFLGLHLTVFTLNPGRKNLRDKVMASYCLALLMSFSSFLLGQISGGLACYVLFLLTYFSFLSSFSWMLTMSFDVWYSILKAKKLRPVHNQDPSTRFIIYSVWSWLIPGIMVFLSLVIEKLPSESVPASIKPKFGSSTCWFTDKKALRLLFSLPVAVAMTLNSLLFFSIISMTYSAVSKNHAKRTAPHLQFYARLTVITGLTWILGLVADLVETRVLWGAFIILNSFQGLFFYLCFTCTKMSSAEKTSSMTECKTLRSTQTS